MKQPLATLFALFYTATFLSAQTPGTLDAGFGAGGYTQTDFANISNTARIILQQPDGKFVLLGTGNQDNLTISHILAMRYLPNGTRDNSFGAAGVYAETGFGTTPSAVEYRETWSGVLQPDGKTLIAGTVKMNSILRHFLIRLNANGLRDASFGTNGFVFVNTINWFEPRAHPVGLALQTDGKILLFSGIVQDGNFTLIRFTADGAPDASFGTGGMLHLTSSLPNLFTLQGKAVAIQPDGKILAQALSKRSPPLQSQMHLFRLLPDGSPDSSFSGDGEALLNGTAEALDITNQIYLQPDGKILVGRLNSLTRLLPNGELDNTFGTNGNSVSSLNFYNCTLQQDGKIVCAGFLSGRALLVRLNENGSGDNTINATGISGVMDLLESPSVFFDVIQQPDGKIVACGRKDGDFLIARYHSQAVSAVHDPLEALTAFQVGPNPTRGPVQLYFSLSEPQALSLAVVNATGQLVQAARQAVYYPVGDHILPVDLSGLPAGPYFLILTGISGQRGILVDKVD